MAMEKRRSGNSFSSLGSIFGFDDEIDEDPLSEFQQQSLSVFESEHMWAHFQALLADRNIQTTAGVRAMLPDFVHDRVLDGSIIEHPVYPSCMRREESFGNAGTRRSIRSVGTVGTSSNGSDHPVYPKSMRRQESFGTNTALYGQPRTQSVDNSNHGRTRSGSSNLSIDSYHEAIRGDTESVLSLYSSVNLLTSVSRRLSKMRSNGVFFSKWSASHNSGASDVQSPLRIPISESSGSRPKFRRSSLSTDEDILTYEQQLFGADFNNQRRPSQSESSMQSDLLSEMTGLLDEVLLLDGLGEIKNECKIDNSFSYQPHRNKGDRKDNPQVHDNPAFDHDTNTETNNDSVAHKNEVAKDVPKDPTVPSFNSLDTCHTLLVEWGESDSTSDDEYCDGDRALLDDSENAVVVYCLQ